MIQDVELGTHNYVLAPLSFGNSVLKITNVLGGKGCDHKFLALALGSNSANNKGIFAHLKFCFSKLLPSEALNICRSNCLLWPHPFPHIEFQNES